MKSPPHRGLQDIRTMSERISDADNPQRKYLALAMLELERARRNKEKLSASQRVANIDQRLAEITTTQADLLATAEADLQASGAVGRPHGGPSAQPAQGFTLSY
jgi:predicted  nucleic acid-binding Zn-ribbon protein